MDIGTIRAFFGWCSILNMGIILLWFFADAVLHDTIYRIHTKWFKLSVEKFDQIHYTGIAIFKIAVIVFNIVPYFALRIVG